MEYLLIIVVVSPSLQPATQAVALISRGRILFGVNVRVPSDLVNLDFPGGPKCFTLDVGAFGGRRVQLMLRLDDPNLCSMNEERGIYAAFNKDAL